MTGCRKPHSATSFDEMDNSMKIFALTHRVIFVVLALIFLNGAKSDAVYLDGIGLVPGVEFSIPSATQDPLTPGKPRITFTIGAFADFAFDSEWAFSPELRYSEKGALVDFLTLLPGTVQLSTIDLYLQFKKRFSRYFSVVGGPYVGFFLKRNMELLSLINFDLSNRFNSLDLGFTLGLEASAPISERLDFISQLRFQHGLFDMNTDTADSYVTRDLQLTVGLKYVME